MSRVVVFDQWLDGRARTEDCCGLGCLRLVLILYMHVGSHRWQLGCRWRLGVIPNGLVEL